MAVVTIKQPWQLLVQNLFFILLFVYEIPFSVSQTNNSPQNIETFYPFPIDPTPSPAPLPPNNRPNSSLFNPVSPQLPPVERKSSSKRTVAKAVVATAGSTFVVATLLFFLIQRFVIAPRRRKEKNSDTNNNNTTTDSRGGSQVVFMGNDQFSRMDGNLKGLIVDENGLDVLYWRKLEGNSKENNFQKEVLRSQEDDEEEDISRNDQRRKSVPLQERPLLLGKSSASHKKVVPETDVPERKFFTDNNQSAGAGTVFKATEKSTSQSPNPPQPPRRTPPQPIQSSMAIPSKEVPGLPPPPPPQIPAKKNHPPPPPPPPNLPPAPKGTKSSNSEAGKSSTGDGQVKLKPLHWDKVNKNAGHSMVWDKIDNGSFRFDDNLMEALFGTVATNRKSPKGESLGNPKSSNSSPTTQIVILDARRSQNTAIVLKSLAISRSELLDALNDGYGLNVDTLEKLTKIAPTQEEQSQILEFDGSPTRLADAESFIYHLLKAVPSAFMRLNAMLFRANYDSEIVQFKESLQILESACKELRNRGLFVKLLEAILKAGNRMNAGTSRGNAEAFKLNSLQKLSDVKSIDGKTTLLHFVVEEVVQSEGKRCAFSRNHSLNRSSSQRSNSSVMSESSYSKEEREKEYIMLGLPVVGGLSAEFSNVKKAAQVDYDSFSGTCSALAARTAEVRLLVSQCASTSGEGGFVREMKGFLETAEKELKALTQGQMRIMGVVKKTTEYYQAGASKDQGANPLQLFVIIRDFLGMFDQVCIEIARDLQRRKTSASRAGSSPKSPASRLPVRFPNLPEHFMKEKSMGSSSESDSDF